MPSFKLRGTSPCGLREVQQLNRYGQEQSPQETEALPVSVDEPCHIARVNNKPVDVLLQGNISSPMCGVPGAPVPRADQTSAGLSEGPICCVEDVVRADDVYGNLLGCDNCGASKGGYCDDWLEMCRIEDEDNVMSPDAISVPSCGALGAPVLSEDQNGIGLKSGPDVRVARVVSADVCGNLQGDNNSGAGKGVPEVVLQENCKIKLDGDGGIVSLEVDDAVCRASTTGTETKTVWAGRSSLHAQRDTCPWYWFWRTRMGRGIQFQCFVSPVTMSVAGPHWARPGMWALCGYWGCNRRVPFHGPGPPPTTCHV